MTLPRTARRPDVRARLLETAGRLFYAEGIHAVGIDRILAEADVAKASLYHHFESKDGLVAAYLEDRSDTLDQALGEGLDGIDADADARRRLVVVFESIWSGAQHSAFRGCPFLNAAVEYPEPDHPVRCAVTRHRKRFATLISEQLERGGLDPTPTVVGAVVLTYDGAMVTAQIEDLAHAKRATDQILDALLPKSRRGPVDARPGHPRPTE